MTYDTRERSIESAAPVELYTFTRAALTYRYTSDAADLVVLAQTYLARTLQRGQVEASGERARNTLSITCARDFEIADMFRVAPPTDIVALTVQRVHRGDSDPKVIWAGRVVNCEWSGGAASLNCEPVSSSLRRPGLRRMYQRQCPHVLYGQGEGQCGVVRASHSTATTVVSTSGLILNVAALGSKPWAGGFVEWEISTGTFERRFISSFSGLALTLSQPFQGIAPGQAITVSPGCDHTMATCEATYANLLNYGGFPFIPTKNPFDGTPVF